MYVDPEYTWEDSDLDIRQPHHYYTKPPLHHYRSGRITRRQSTSSRHDQQIYSPTYSRSPHYNSPYYFVSEEDLEDSPAPSWRSPGIPADHLLDNYYMNSIPVSPWSLPFKPSRRRKSSTYTYMRPKSYDNDDDEWNQDLHEWDHDDSVMLNDRHYFNVMMPPESAPKTSLFRRRSYADSPSKQTHHLHRPTNLQSTRRSSRHTNRDRSYYHYQQEDSLDDYSDDNDYIQLDKKQYSQYHPLQHMDTSLPWTDSPTSGHSTISRRHRQEQRPVLHQQWHSRLDQGPVQDTGTPNLYGRVPPIIQPPMLPMLQPMIQASQATIPPHHHLNYGFPTITGMMPEPVIPFNPMIMPQPSHFHFQNETNSSNIKSQQQSDTATTTETTQVESSSKDNIKDSSQPHHDSSIQNKPENSLVPLVRSLSLGSSQSSHAKPRRRSLFESLFNLNGRSRTNSLSSTTSTDQDSSTSPNTLSSSSTLSSSLIPLNELTTQSLSRRQSLSLEKTAKALSQRSYIWCYRLRPSRGSVEESCWVAMTPKNQTRLDPYLVYYHPEGTRKAYTRNLPTLVTLDKEPKLTGSLTAMPQAKIARVYPSVFSSANYIELLLDCLPADSQFAVRSD